MTKFKIRIAAKEYAADDFDRIQKFLENHRHEGNAVRDPAFLMKAIIDNKAYIIEDNDLNIVGVSFCFSIEDGLFTEGGGTRIIVPGYRLQRIINYVKAVNEFMLDPPQIEYYSIIADWNEKSRNNILAVGFEDWKPNDSLLRLIKSDLTGKSFYRLPRRNLNSIKDALLEIIDIGYLNGRPPLPRAQIELDISIVRDRRLSRDYDFGEGEKEG